MKNANVIFVIFLFLVAGNQSIKHSIATVDAFLGDSLLELDSNAFQANIPNNSAAMIHSTNKFAPNHFLKQAIASELRLQNTNLKNLNILTNN